MSKRIMFLISLNPEVRAVKFAKFSLISGRSQYSMLENELMEEEKLTNSLKCSTLRLYSCKVYTGGK